MSEFDATRLFVALGRVTREIRRSAPAAEVSHSALGVISTLGKCGPQRLGALAEAEGVSPPTMTKIVTALEDLALVRRTTDPADGRASLVEVTEAGARLAATGKGEKLAALARRIADLDPADQAALEAALPALEQLGTPPAR